MNDKKGILYIGDTNVTTYQKAIIVVGIILILFFVIIAVLTQNQYYKYFSIIILIIFSGILFFYSKLYNVSCNSQNFYVKNLFKRKIIEKGRFIEIRKVKFIDFLQLVVFENDKFLVLKTSKNYFTDIFKSSDIVVNELTTEIKKFIS